MGMAASQARLLLLTSRIHDVELKAQQLQTAKLQLATEQDAVYEEYQKALDATTLTFTISENGIESSVAATFNNLFSVNAANSANGNDFCLIDSRGRVVVSDDIYEAIGDYPGLDNPYAFAAWMLYGRTGGQPPHFDNDFINIVEGIIRDNFNSDSTLADLYSKAMTGRGRTTPLDFMAPQNNTIHSGDNLLGQGELPGQTVDNDNDSDIDDDIIINDNVLNQHVNTGVLPAADNDDDDDSNKIIPTPHNPFGSIVLGQPAVKGGNGGKGGDGAKGTGSDDRSSAGAPSLLSYKVIGGTTPPAVTITDPSGNDEINEIPGGSNILDGAGRDGGMESYVPGSIGNILMGTGSVHPEFCQQFLNYLFSTYGNQIFNRDNNIPEEDYDRFNYYVRLYGAIQQHGGCISIDEFNGPSGDAASNSEWLTNMIQSGQLTIETVDVDDNGLVSTTGTTVASETSLSYTASTQLDRAVLARAEAEYEHAMKVIDRKEQKIDRELNKIETERGALTKQYDSIKKVIDDNVDRTFGIFS